MEMKCMNANDELWLLDQTLLYLYFKASRGNQTKTEYFHSLQDEMSLCTTQISLVKSICIVALKRKYSILYVMGCLICFLFYHHLHASCPRRTAASKSHVVPVKVVFISVFWHLREDSNFKFGVPNSLSPCLPGDSVGSEFWYFT